MNFPNATLSFDEALTVVLEEYAPVELACAPLAGATLEVCIGGELLEPFLRPGDSMWRWRWSASGAAGVFLVELRAQWPDGGTRLQTHTLDVRPRKLDTERYAALLADLQALSRHLVLALGGGATPATLPRPSEPTPQTPAEALAVLTGPELERFAVAVQRIARRPPERTRPTIAPVDPGQARDLSRLGATRLELADEVPPDPDAPISAAHLRTIPEQQSTPTHDSYELRFVQRTLAVLTRRMDQLLGTPHLPPSAATALAEAQAQVRSLRALPALAGIAPLEQYRGPTPRLQRDADYRVVFRMWQNLRRRPELAWTDTTLELPVAELPLLYERWCVLAVATALLRMPDWRVVSQHLLAPQPADAPADWLLSLPTDKPLVTLELPNGAQAALWYQPRYRPKPQRDRLGSLDRHTRIPDLALSITRPAAAPLLAILDAKYRLDATGGVPEAALADAYSYLGSIGLANGQRSVCGTAILFPGSGPAESYLSGVAALPLIPGSTGSLRAWLEAQIENARLESG